LRLLYIMKNAIIILFLSFFACGSIIAHNGTESIKLVTGKVIDKETGETLAGVRIQVKGTDTFCYTDLNGNYSLALNSKPDTEIQIEVIGYSPLTLKSAELGSDSELLLNPR